MYLAIQEFILSYSFSNILSMTRASWKYFFHIYLGIFLVPSFHMIFRHIPSISSSIYKYPFHIICMLFKIKRDSVMKLFTSDFFIKLLHLVPLEKPIYEFASDFDFWIFCSEVLEFGTDFPMMMHTTVGKVLKLPRDEYTGESLNFFLPNIKLLPHPQSF